MRDAFGVLCGVVCVAAVAFHVWGAVGFVVVILYGPNASPPDWALYGCVAILLRAGLEWFLPERWKGWPF